MRARTRKGGGIIVTALPGNVKNADRYFRLYRRADVLARPASRLRSCVYLRRRQPVAQY